MLTALPSETNAQCPCLVYLSRVLVLPNLTRYCKCKHDELEQWNSFYSREQPIFLHCGRQLRANADFKLL